MARKSNKTAHVLNLLAGHDAAKDADEHTSAEQNTSDHTTAQAAHGNSGEAAQAAPDGTAGQAVSSDAGTASGNTGQPAVAAPVNTPAPAPSPAAPPQNNIAMIDKTEDDPVAELIQQKLSSEFEKQIQQSQPDIASNPTAGTAEAPSVSASDTSAVPEAAIDAMPVSNSGRIDIPETAVPSAKAPIQEPAPVPQASNAPVSASEAAPVQEAAPIPQATDVPASTSKTTPVQKDAPAPHTTATSASAVAAESVEAAVPELLPTPEAEPEADFVTVNVMENIVNDKIIYFMRQFHVCTCSRCKADVIALTLNGLMPKYIVTMKTAVDPLLSYYTNRLISDVTVEATKACIIVKDNPRH